MKAIVIALVCLLVAAELVAARSNSREWNLFKRRYGKSYRSPAEEARRFANFLATKQKIERHNAAPNRTHTLSLNHLADLSKEEFARLNGLKHDPIATQKARLALTEHTTIAKILADDSPLPEEVDWRKVPGRVSEVKDQGNCGSC